MSGLMASYYAGRRSVLGGGLGALGTWLSPGSSSEAVPRDAHRRPILLRGGTVLTGAAANPVLPEADVLVIDDRIQSVGRNLTAPGASIVACEGKLVAATWIDTHVHLWEALFPYAANGLTFLEYLDRITSLYLSRMKPHDIYVGEYLGALKALNAGIGTVTSWCHAIRNPDDAQAALAGVYDSGAWSVFLHGYNSLTFATQPGPNLDYALMTAQAAETRGSRPKGGGVLKSGLAVAGPQFGSLDEFARQVEFVRNKMKPGSILSWHDGIPIPGLPSGIARAAAAGLLGPEQLVVHGVSLSDAEFRAMAQAGTKLSVSPMIDERVFDVPPYARAVAAGLAPAVSSDDAALGGGRLRAHLQALVTGQQRTAMHQSPPGRFITDYEAMALVTSQAAAALGLTDLGAIEPGKRAGVMVVDPHRLDLGPVTAGSAVGAVLDAPDAAIEAVMIDGHWRKWRGSLVGVDTDSLLDEASRIARRIMKG